MSVNRPVFIILVAGLELRLLVCLAALAAPSLAEPWWENALIYQVYPRSFKDTNGDGIGDIKGIADNADYFKELGVTAVWLSPIYQSPKKDFGYDVSDYRAIDPDFGTMQDFDNMVKAFKDRGIRVMLDFIPNHTSDEHDWFKQACNGTKPYSDYYVWRPNANNWMAIFPDKRHSAWSKCKQKNSKEKKFYYHVFGDFQPDLNYHNDQVVKEMQDVLQFWMDKGVEGFRMDAVPYLAEDRSFADESLNKGCNDRKYYDCLNHTRTMDQQRTYDVLKNLTKFVQEYVPQNGTKAERVVFYEAYTSKDNTMKYYDSLGIPFNFNFVTGLHMWSDAKEFERLIRDWMNSIPQNKTANWVIGNHDNSRIGSKLGPEMVDSMNMLNLLLPGVTVTYYGEELGMVDLDVKKKIDISNRDPERTPFQWSDELYAGFMTVNDSSNARPWLPVNPNYWEVNKKKEDADESSHLKVYKKLVELKKKLGEKATSLKVSVIGNWTLVVERSNNDTKAVVVINLNDVPEKVDLTKVTDTSHLKVHLTSVNTDKNLMASKNFSSLQIVPRSGVVLVTDSAASIATSSLFLLMGILFSVYHYF